jgi:hypothetical protein
LAAWAPKQRATEPFLDKGSSFDHINHTAKTIYGKNEEELKGKHAAFKKLCKNWVSHRSSTQAGRAATREGDGILMTQKLRF